MRAINDDGNVFLHPMTSTIEKFSEHALQGVEAELKRLLSVDVRLALSRGSLMRAADFIDSLDAETVAVKLEMDGASEGNGVLAVSRRDAIRLAGKLLMLPAMEINQSIADGVYDSEYRFAFGEIVKSFVRSFIVSLPETPYRCVEITCRDKQVDSRSDASAFLGSLQQNQSYYSAVVSISLSDSSLGDIQLLLPSIMMVGSPTFGSGEIGHPESVGAAVTDGEPGADRNNTVNEAVPTELISLFDAFLDRWVGENNGELEGVFTVKAVRSGDLHILDEAVVNEQSSDGETMFGSYQVDGPSNCHVIVSAGFEAVAGMGSLLGQAAQPDTRQSRITGPPDSEMQDGFHELVTILLSSLAAQLCRLEDDAVYVARGISSLSSGNDGFPSLFQVHQDEQYFVQQLSIAKGGVNLGELRLLFPRKFIEHFKGQMIESGCSTGEHESVERSRGGNENSRTAAIGNKILLINASYRISESLRVLFDMEGFPCDVEPSISPDLQRKIAMPYAAIFLAVDTVDEIALSTIIKIRSSDAVPLVVAAPQWTQSQVVKALNYGATDIVLTPLDGPELREKMRRLSTTEPL